MNRRKMNQRWITNFLLLLIAFCLLAIAARPYLSPQPALAQSGSPYPFYIEPGTQMLRAPDGSKQVLGRMVIDMRTGKIWGFPTYTQDAFPSNQSMTESKPPVSHPFAMGRFAFEDVDKQP